MHGGSGPLLHRQLGQWVADHLRSDILEGRRQPGEWLRQEQMARELNVSQTPVREALKQLVAEGLLEHVPYRGIQVVRFALADVEDLCASRAVLEPMAAASRRAFLTRTLGQLWSAFPTMLWSSVPHVAPTSEPERDDPDAAEHAEIVAALQARDAGRAARAMKGHIEAAGRTLVAAMRRQRRPASPSRGAGRPEPAAPPRSRFRSSE